MTHRCFQSDPETANNGGQVIEMLSEHTLQGFLQGQSSLCFAYLRIYRETDLRSFPSYSGYTLTGRTGLFPSYESFLGIVTTMIEQYAKASPHPPPSRRVSRY